MIAGRISRYGTERVPLTFVDDHRILATPDDQDTDIGSLIFLDTTSCGSVTRVPRHIAPFCHHYPSRILVIALITYSREDDGTGDPHVIIPDPTRTLAHREEKEIIHRAWLVTLRPSNLVPRTTNVECSTESMH